MPRKDVLKIKLHEKFIQLRNVCIDLKLDVKLCLEFLRSFSMVAPLI